MILSIKKEISSILYGNNLIQKVTSLPERSSRVEVKIKIPNVSNIQY